jgi:hypothetical protein
MTARKNGKGSPLPRLGSADAKPSPSLTRPTHVVDIPERGVSLVLQKPSVRTIIDLQEDIDLSTEDVRKAYGSTVKLVALMLVDPEMPEDDLRAEVDEWSLGDWQILQREALDLAGIGEEAERQRRAEFPEPGKGPEVPARPSA